VFGVFADRLADLMALAGAVAFQRLEQRLAHFGARSLSVGGQNGRTPRCKSSPGVQPGCGLRLACGHCGHQRDPFPWCEQALADALGTVREIVTRLLKRFERASWVRLGRERIELADAAALRALAAGTPPA
jgi:CRP/FNR family transcriptional regulator